MEWPRASGVLVHPTSFPGPHGIGDLGEAAFRFVDWLVQAGQQWWQILPLGPSGPGDSPYASPSAFAGNPLLVSLNWLVGDGLLDAGDVASDLDFAQHEVDYPRVRAYKMPLLRQAFDRFRRGAASDQRQAFEAFVEEQRSWLDDYALFMALKHEHGGVAWTDWPADLALRRPEALVAARDQLRDDLRFEQFAQFQFRRQWVELRRHANEHGVRIIGDLPIFVAHDSADVWSHSELFRLDVQGRPTALAGVPPDAFTSTGQLWGNPLYDWEAAAATSYAWWVERVRALLGVVDVLRIDHFRGFAAAWVVPAGAETAASGHWEKGPGAAVFAAMTEKLGDLPFLVEDLGLITPDVIELRRELGLPGMKVLQFAFDGGPGNAYLPHNYEADCVVYPATHDNQTTVGWFHTRSDWERQNVERYLGKDGTDISWDFIRLALGSVANTAILPLQDVMRLGDEARMNTPGRGDGNWRWRFLAHQLHPGMAADLGDLTTTFRRAAARPGERGYDPFDYTAPHAAHPLT